MLQAPLGSLCLNALTARYALWGQCSFNLDGRRYLDTRAWIGPDVIRFRLNMSFGMDYLHLIPLDLLV
jgi:hypothetical protein